MRRADLVLAAFCAALGVLLYGWTLGLQLLGFDAYPLIAAAKIASLGDLIGTFGEELMDGRYADGSFYRPTTHLAFALDHALYGLRPFGYHLTDLATLVANGFLLGLLAKRLSAGRARFAPFAAALVFLTSTAQLEVVPFPARRADALALLFTLATLIALPASGARSRKRVGLATVFAFLACGAKESGVLVLPLVLGLEVLARPSTGALRSALQATVPVALAVAAYLILRTLVLGGFGGHSESMVFDLGSAWSVAMSVATGPPESGPAGWVVAGAAFAVLVLLALTAGRGEEGAAVSSPHARGALVWTLAWAVLLGLVTALSGRTHSWYGMLFLAPLALLLGQLLELGLERLRAKRWAIGVVATGLAVWLIGAVVLSGAAPLDRSLIREASDAAENQLARFETLIDAATPGSNAPFDPWWMAYEAGDRSVLIHAPYTFEGYAELARPDVVIDAYAHAPGTPLAPPRNGVVLVPCVLRPANPR